VANLVTLALDGDTPCVTCPLFLALSLHPRCLSTSNIALLPCQPGFNLLPIASDIVSSSSSSSRAVSTVYNPSACPPSPAPATTVHSSSVAAVTPAPSSS
jgi:hypothetical protein